MRAFLRRTGILVFAGFSSVLWVNVAEISTENGLVMLAGSRTLMLGASLACLTAMVISELSNWGQNLMDSTRREVMLAELTPSDWQDADDTVSGRYSEESFSWSEATLETDAGGGKREWIDVRHPVEVEGAGG